MYINYEILIYEHPISVQKSKTVPCYLGWKYKTLKISTK